MEGGSRTTGLPASILGLGVWNIVACDGDAMPGAVTSLARDDLLLNIALGEYVLPP